MKLQARLFALWISIIILPQTVAAADTLIPVGQVIGIELQEDKVIVAAFDDALGGAAETAGLRVGDEILSMDGLTVDSAADVKEALAHSKGLVSLVVLRDGKEQTIRIAPVITADGPRLGVYLRQGVTGIGTVTWYDPDSGRFGALGHGVNNAEGMLVDMTGGSAYDAGVQSVKRGKVGQPGQLIGTVTEPDPLGVLEENTCRGIFGTCPAGWAGEAYPVGAAEDVTTGTAVIRSTVTGETPREYSVEILKIYPGNRNDGRNMLIRVTDPELLAATGGIVQGMSGSPIIQNGKLVGAVTHVLVNDPQTGYGIFIENMLDAAA